MNYYFIVYAHKLTAYGKDAWIYHNKVIKARHPLIWFMRASKKMGYPKGDFKLIFYDKLPAEVATHPNLELYFE